MRKFFFTLLLCILVGVVYLYQDDLYRFYDKYLDNDSRTKYDDIKVSLGKTNEYFRDLNFNFVQVTDNFRPNNKQDLYNIYYTIINAGKDEFTFYCPSTWKECIDEVKYLSNDQANLSNINNFVHPFNSFRHIETSYDSNGKIILKIKHAYTDSDILNVKSVIEKIENELKNDSLDNSEQIRLYHDYIVNNTVYDSDRSDNNIINYKSDIAYGTLVEGHSLCGGYTDAMAILLNDMGIPNYKVTSKNHIWNAVKLGDVWYNLDLTWDDPVTQNGIQLIEHDFFLITTEKLKQIEQTEHSFDEAVYSELVS